jgi:transcriptional regulator of heat shock response
MDFDPKLLALLDVVIDNYINKGEPVGSKFLHSLGDSEYAPSTLRKYLNVLEKAGMVYQPYNSSWRIPTVQGLSLYIDSYLTHQEEEKVWEIKDVRKGLTFLVENMGGLVDGVVVGFIRNDEYYYLGINNLLRDDMVDEYQMTRNIIRFIEEKRVVKYIDSKILKRNQIYYTFIEDRETIVSCLYAKIAVKDYDCIISIIGPTRVNYKKNVAVLRKLLQSL